MRTKHIFSAIVLTAALAVTLPALSDTTVRTLAEAVPVESAEWISIELPVGDLEVLATDGDSVHVHLKVRCEERSSDRSWEAAKDIELKTNRHFDGIEIEIKGWPKFRSKGLSLEGRLEIPRQLALEINLGVGEVTAFGLENDLEIDLGVGEVTVEMPESAVRSVNLDAGVGEAALRVRDRTIEGSGFIGHGLDWSGGPGRARVEIDCGVGSITVRLE